MTSTMHRQFLRSSRFLVATLVVLTTFVAGVGVLSATAQGEDAIIYGCVHTNSGGIRIVGDASSCKSYETLLSWSRGGTATAVHWGDIVDVPDGIKNQVAEDVQCNGCVSTNDLDDLSVQTSKLKNMTVTTDKLAQQSVTSEKLAPDAVTSEAIVNGSITSGDLADGSVTGVKVADGSVTDAKLADDSVTGAKLADLSVSSASIVDGSVTGDDVSEGSLTGAHIEDGSVMTHDVEANTATGQHWAMLFISGPSGMHKAMVFGDAKVTCVDSNGCSGTISWDVSVGSVIAGERSMYVFLNPGEEIIVSAQEIIDMEPGSNTVYLNVRFSEDGATTTTHYSVNAVDLGSK